MIWQADQIQAVLFPLPSAPQLDALEAWKTVVGGAQPSSYIKPDISPLSVSIAEGTHNGFRLVVQSQLGRLDFFLLAAPDIINTSEPPRISNVEQGLVVLREIVMEALSNTRVTRFGLIANLSEIHSDMNAVAERLTALSDAWFPRPALDCVRQLNVRREFVSPPHFEMNRVMTWQSGNYTLHVRDQLTKLIPQLTFKIDINSVTTNDISKYASAMFAESCSELVVICDRGIEAIR